MILWIKNPMKNIKHLDFMILSFSKYVNEIYENLNELKYSYIYKRTPKRYKDRAEDIKVRFITRKKDRYYYQTTTQSNGHKHKQWIMPLYPTNKIPFNSIQNHVVSHCDCNDFRYENEWLLWTKDASWLISSNKKPLQRMNPERIPKFCKHLVAIKTDLFNRLQ